MLFKSIALAAAAVSPVAGAGCYPTWRSGGDYFSGSYVSATRTTTTTASDGTKTTTTVTKNFKCTSGSQPSLSHCPTYDPSNANIAAAAWSDQGVCVGTQPLVTPAPTPKPTFAQWSGVGCPKEWREGTSYAGGELAEVDGVAYECSDAFAVSTWCGQSTYKPGDSLYWQQAWKRLGSCDGTIAPTTSPMYVRIADAGGCPEEYSQGESYEEGDKVMKNNIVYKCRSWPNSGWCNNAAYEPGTDIAKDAWDLLGYCDGKIEIDWSITTHFLCYIHSHSHLVHIIF
jgi:hypothetical protein